MVKTVQAEASNVRQASRAGATRPGREAPGGETPGRLPVLLIVVEFRAWLARVSATTNARLGVPTRHAILAS